jgi:hypothetical protein
MTVNYPETKKKADSVDVYFAILFKIPSMLLEDIIVKKTKVCKSAKTL